MWVSPTQKVEKLELCARIPHAGKMCLLEQVLGWDQTHIHCLATSHRNHDNPLRARGVLGSVSGVEYAAQAMAVHGSLIDSHAQAGPRPGFIVSLRDVRLFVDRLDLVQEDLQVRASQLSGSEGGFVYEFEVSANQHCLLSGRIGVVLLGRELLS